MDSSVSMLCGMGPKDPSLSYTTWRGSATERRKSRREYPHSTPSPLCHRRFVRCRLECAMRSVIYHRISVTLQDLVYLDWDHWKVCLQCTRGSKPTSRRIFHTIGARVPFLIFTPQPGKNVGYVLRCRVNGTTKNGTYKLNYSRLILWYLFSVEK